MTDYNKGIVAAVWRPDCRVTLINMERKKSN